MGRQGHGTGERAVERRQLKQAGRLAPFAVDGLVLVIAGGGAVAASRNLGHRGVGTVLQPLQHPWPAVGTDVLDGGGEGITGLDHLAHGFGLGRTGGGLAQAVQGGGGNV